ncbi:MAG TPA: ABC transporter ATP-binding protein [Steroidobacteraceae bacterium]|nr:ABC transporter ATP-binding protein [Steroidobacteraceae bacterium]
MSNNFIYVAGLSYRYPGARGAALEAVDLAIPEGSSFALLGPNGAGKTTLLSIMMGLLSPQAGDVSVAGYSIKNDLEKIKSISALVPQDFAFYAKLTGYENLRFFADIYGLSATQWQQQLEYCTHVCQLQDMLSRRTSEYSGGMKRRLNLAIGLLNGPKILYLDEPTVGIDALSRQVVISAIQSLRAQGTTIIYTSHYMEEVEAICDELAIINRGRVVARDRTTNLRQQGTEKSVTLTFAATPSAECLNELRRWPLVQVHERRIELTLSGSDELNAVLDVCKRYQSRIEQMQFGVSRLEQTYLELLKANEAEAGEAAA